MGRRHALLRLSFVILFAAVSTADDGAAMLKLASSITPLPSGWDAKSSSNLCKSWSGVKCDNSGKVTSIDLNNGGISGTLPADISTLSQLQNLALQKNTLTGTIPPLADMSSLQEIYLANNGFTSVASDAFKGLSSLQTLSLSNNNLSAWAFPDLSQSTGLVSLYVDSCNIQGPLPDVFGAFTSLQDLRISYNNLTGSLPQSLGQAPLKNFWANNQAAGLSGRIDVVSQMSQLVTLWLQKNQFSGPIPDLSNCTGFWDLQLRDNLLTGPVPSSLIGLPSLGNVTLNNNKLQGPTPTFPSSVEKVQLDQNNWCTNNGSCNPQVSTMLEIAGGFGYPADLSDDWTGNNACKFSFVTCDGNGSVATINLAKKNYTGFISPSIGNLTGLKTLTLNDNHLTGSIPVSLTKLPSLQSVDVSNNNLTGGRPQFSGSVNFVYAGNPSLERNDSSGSGGGSGGSNDGGSGGSSSVSGKRSKSVIIGVIVGLVVFLSVLCFVLFKFIVRRRYGKFGRVGGNENDRGPMKSGTASGINSDGTIGNQVAVDIQSQTSGDRSDRYVFEGGNVVIPIQVIQQVTNNFSEDNILGKGGFGVVYKGEMHDGTKIAVKRMESSLMGTKGLNEFQAEIAVLTKVRHRHLVALLGYCINGHERLLVYEYMPQGNLGHHLFEWQRHGYHPLTWKQRVHIALDVARGVEYLHSLAQQSFIHRDLKSTNILLGDGMRAKVADFGLVKNAPDGKYSVETRLAGTFGYLAPEYAATGRVTTKVDVYAFGVVLMELITGRKALDDSMPDEKAHLVTWFRRVLINKENIPKAADGALDLDEETLNSVNKVAELAGHCTAREPYQRPDMGHAVNILSPLVEQWKPTHQEDDEGIDLQMSLPQALQRWQANEGTSTMFDDSMSMSFSETQSSIPTKPPSFADTFRSSDCR